MSAQAELSIASQMEVKQVSLISKLAEACAAVGFVPKKGHNSRQDYDYMRATDVAAAIRNELFSRHIVLLCDEKDYKHIRVVKTNSGGEMVVGLLQCAYTFKDGESGETLGPLGAFGEGMDSGDKALNKCKTAALKYVLRGIGLIPDADPEADEQVDEFLSRPHTGVDVDFDQRTAPSDYDDSQLVDAPPSRPQAPGACKACGGRVIPSGVSKRTGKPYGAFCKECKMPA